MRKISILLILAALGFSVMGCTTFKKMTGQTDDTVLPGQREDILPPEAQTAKDPAVNSKKSAAPSNSGKCAPDDLNCVPPADQESSTPQ
jgi:hypothetical protein